jgi:hypothetical protein
MFTDGEGHFEFTLPKANNENQSGIYSGQPHQMWSVSGTGSPVWLMARKPGYLDDPNEGRQSPPPGGDNTISLIPEALIQGRVVISEADPPAGINVELYSQQVQDGRISSGLLSWCTGFLHGRNDHAHRRTERADRSCSDPSALLPCLDSACQR